MAQPTPMTATLTWVDGQRYVAESASGHSLVLDGDRKTDAGPSPMELVLLGMGGCTSYDVISILRKARQNVTNCVTQLHAERAADVPAVFTKIHVHFVVSGVDLQEAAVARAVALSADKYCSASIMLGRGGVEISHDFEISETNHG